MAKNILDEVDLVDRGLIPPDDDERSGGEEPTWTSVFWFSGRITNETYEVVRSVIKGAAHVHPDDERHAISFGVRGFMDEAIYDAADKIQPLLGRVITNKVDQVLLISIEDVMRNLKEGTPTYSYDVTHTTVEILGIKTEG